MHETVYLVRSTCVVLLQAGLLAHHLHQHHHQLLFFRGIDCPHSLEPHPNRRHTIHHSCFFFIFPFAHHVRPPPAVPHGRAAARPQRLLRRRQRLDAPQGRQGPQDHPQGLLRHHRGRQAAGPHRHGSVRQDDARDGRELPRPGHGRKGHGLRGLDLPPRHQAVHDPGRRFHQPRRHGRGIDLREEVPRRELQAQAYQEGPALHGQLGQGHQRLAVLYYHRHHLLARRQARRFWRGSRGLRRGREDRADRDGSRRQAQEDHQDRQERRAGRAPRSQNRVRRSGLDLGRERRARRRPRHRHRARVRVQHVRRRAVERPAKGLPVRPYPRRRRAVPALRDAVAPGQTRAGLPEGHGVGDGDGGSRLWQGSSVGGDWGRSVLQVLGE